VSRRGESLVRRLLRAGRAGGARAARPAASFVEVERAERVFYLDYLRDGMTVFDAGANVGDLTMLFSRFVGRAGRVHAFEPSGEGFERLSAVCRAASLDNVTANRLALAEREGTVRLHVYGGAHLSWTTLAARPLEDYGIAVKPAGVEEVPATTVELYCERHGIGQIDLLKVDVEGAELQVMRGAERLLREGRVRCLTFEFGQTTFDMGNSPEAVEAFLDGVGYEVRNLVAGDPVFPGRASAQAARYSMHVATPKGARP
jgi:FkbM family methyltransferase